MPFTHLSQLPEKLASLAPIVGGTDVGLVVGALVVFLALRINGGGGQNGLRLA